MTIEFLAIIPARSGSKEVINKNVKKIRGVSFDLLDNK